MTIALTFGPWGGFYCHWGYTKRLCLGWVAITFFPVDIDALLQDSESVVKTIVDYSVSTQCRSTKGGISISIYPEDQNHA